MICNYLVKTILTVELCVLLCGIWCSAAPHTRRSAANISPTNCSTDYQPASPAVQLVNGMEVAERFTVSLSFH